MRPVVILFVIACATAAFAQSPTSLTFDPATWYAGDAGGVIGTVGLSEPALADVTVTLSNSVPRGGALAVPATVIVRRGTSIAKFDAIPAIVASGSMTSTIRASVPDGKTYADRNFTSHANYAQTVSVPATEIAGNPVTVTVTVRNNAPAGGTSVTLGHNVIVLKSPEPIGTFTPNPLVIPQGSKTATATLNLQQRWDTATIDVTASNGSAPAAGRLAIKGNMYGSWNYEPCFKSNCTGVGTLSLINPAPQNGVTLSLRSDDVQLRVPPTIFVPPGSLTGNFDLTYGRISAPRTAYITGELFGHTLGALVYLRTGGRVASVTASPTSIIAGSDVNFTVNLLAPAPSPGPVVVSWTWLTNQGTADFLAGTQSKVVTIAAPTVASVTPSSAIFKADPPSATSTEDGSVAQSVQITPLDLTSIAFPTAQVAGGDQANGFVSLNANAPKEGLVVQLQSSAPQIATVPASVIVPAGSRVGQFVATTMRTPGPATVDVRATSPLGTAKTAQLQINATPGITLQPGK